MAMVALFIAGAAHGNLVHTGIHCSHLVSRMSIMLPRLCGTDPVLEASLLYNR